MSNQTEREALIHDALQDALWGWQYIRRSHGNLYGVGWDRVEQKLTAALAAHPPEQENAAAQEHATEREASPTIQGPSTPVAAAPIAQEPVASSKCPICGHDKPHGHSDSEIAGWLCAQAGRFLPDWQRRIIIELGDRVARDERHAQWRHDALVDRADSERTFDDMVAEGFPKDEAYHRMCQGADLQIVQLRERIYQLEAMLAASPPPNTPREE